MALLHPTKPLYQWNNHRAESDVLKEEAQDGALTTALSNVSKQTKTLHSIYRKLNPPAHGENNSRFTVSRSLSCGCAAWGRLKSKMECFLNLFLVVNGSIVLSRKTDQQFSSSPARTNSLRYGYKHQRAHFWTWLIYSIEVFHIP